MNNSMMIEMIGYLGSILVVVSMLMSSVIRLRVINTIGSGVFSIYALIIHSYPTACMNLFLVAINIYNLIKLAQKDRHYILIDESSDGAYIGYLWEYYKQDILKYFPNCRREDLDQVYLVCCDSVPAGFLMGKMKDNGVLEVLVDYSTPTYRDCSVGEYLYSKLPEKGIHTLICCGIKSEKHIEYLNKMGFVKNGDVYRKILLG